MVLTMNNLKRPVYLSFDRLGQTTLAGGNEARASIIKTINGVETEFTHFWSSGDAAAYAKAEGIPPTHKHVFKRSFQQYQDFCKSA